MAAIYPEGRPRYGEVKPKILTRRDGTTYQVYEGCYNAAPKHGGQRKYVSDRDKKQCQKDLRKMQNEVEAGTKAKDGKITLGEVIEEYLYHQDRRVRRGEIRKGTARREKGSLRIVPDKLRRMRLADFRDAGLIEAELKAMLGQYAVDTMTNVKGSLSCVFDFATKSPQAYIPRNVMRDFPFKLGKKAKRKTMATAEEAMQLLHIASQRKTSNRDSHGGDNILTHANLYAILWFILQTGARPQEACGLLVQDIKRYDLPPPDRPSIWADVIIRNTCTYDDGFTENHTKLGHGESRQAQLGWYAVDAFNRVERVWQAKRMAEEGVGRCGPGRGYSGSDVGRPAIRLRAQRNLETIDQTPLELRQHGLMFVNRNGRPYNATTLGIAVRKLVRRAEIYERDREGRVVLGSDGQPEPRVSLYDFRHLVATFNAGALPVHVGAAVTGHSTETYLRTYVHGSAGDRELIAGATGKLEGELAKLLPPPTATKMR